MNNIIVEACCGSVDDVITATQCHVDRIELNQALELGGLTPIVATLLRVKRISTVPIICMVRPRGFGFNYSDEEFKVMLEDARILLENGADGIAFGFLNGDGSINVQRTKQMVALIKPKDAVFHKAIDATKDIEDSLIKLIECGVCRVLTSGGTIYPNIEESYPLLKQLINKYSKDIEILPGGGIRSSNIIELIKNTNCNQVHFSAKEYILDQSTIHFNTSNKDSQTHSYQAISKELLTEMIDKVIKSDI